jgi:hypothetical protein
MRRPSTAFAAVALSMGASSAALAGVVVLDFTDLTGVVANYNGTVRQNVTLNGFRISPECHLDFFTIPDFAGGSDGNVMGWDQAGACGPAGSGTPGLNPDFLGTPTNRAFGETGVYIDAFDHPFAFTSFDLSGRPGGASVVSSKGGHFTWPANTPIDGEFITATLSGPDWTGIRWLEFIDLCAGAPCTPVDNLTFDVGASVANPGTLPLVGIAAIALVANRRLQRRRAGRRDPDPPPVAAGIGRSNV